MFKRLLQQPLIKKILGFSFVGIAVTLFSMFLTFVLLKLVGLSAYLTYFISYFTTISISYYLNSRLVFKSGKSMRNLLLYYGVYGLSLILGIGVLWLYRQLFNWDELILNYMVIPVTMTWNFVVSSRFLKPKQDV